MVDHKVETALREGKLFSITGVSSTSTKSNSRIPKTLEAELTHRGRVHRDNNLFLYFMKYFRLSEPDDRPYNKVHVMSVTFNSLPVVESSSQVVIKGHNSQGWTC
jgi:hypothetical protein